MDNWIVIGNRAINRAHITHAEYREDNHFGPMWVLWVFFTHGDPLEMAGADGQYVAEMLGLSKPKQASAAQPALRRA